MPKILSATTKAEANTELEKWIDSIGIPDHCLNCQLLKQDSSVKNMPDYGDLFQSGNLTPTLAEKLNYIKSNRNQEENYYV